MKFRVGDLVKTKRGVRPKFEGIITEIVVPNKEIQMLWGTMEPHYVVKDSKNNEFLSVIERGLERV